MPRTALDPIQNDSDLLETDDPTADRQSAVIARIRLRPQRRSTPRTAVSIRVAVVTSRMRHDGHVTDLGIGGLFVRVNFVPSCGVRVGIEVTRDGRVVRLPAVVRWVDGSGFGAQFDALTPSEAQVVMTVIAEARTFDR